MTGWDKLIKDCEECKKCHLGETRTNIVIGKGNRNAPLMLIGEGPGRQEDVQGIPFVGQAGKLLDLLLEALFFGQEDYYVANIVKCRPPDNRQPTDEEANKCLPFLREQVRLVNPKIIVCMGNTAIKHIMKNVDEAKNGISKIRGEWYRLMKFWVMPTFHPAALLRDETKKDLMFYDLKRVKERLESIKSGII